MQISTIPPGGSGSTLLPLTLFQNLPAPGTPPSSQLQVALKNNQQPVWYFVDKIALPAFLTEEGRMERSAFLEVRGFGVLGFWGGADSIFWFLKCGPQKCRLFYSDLGRVEKSTFLKVQTSNIRVECFLKSER